MQEYKIIRALQPTKPLNCVSCRTSNAHAPRNVQPTTSSILFHFVRNIIRERIRFDFLVFGIACDVFDQWTNNEIKYARTGGLFNGKGVLFDINLCVHWLRSTNVNCPFHLPGICWDRLHLIQFIRQRNPNTIRRVWLDRLEERLLFAFTLRRDACFFLRISSFDTN